MIESFTWFAFRPGLLPAELRRLHLRFPPYPFLGCDDGVVLGWTEQVSADPRLGMFAHDGLRLWPQCNHSLVPPVQIFGPLRMVEPDVAGHVDVASLHNAAFDD